MPTSVLHYSEAPPPPQLRAVIAAFWQIRGTAVAPLRHAVLPDGCMDLLCDIAGANCGTGRENGWRCVGTATHSETVELHGDVDLVGIRFRPGACATLLRFDADALTNREAKLRDITALSLGPVERLAAASDFGHRIRQLVSALEAGALDPGRDWRLVDHALGRLRRADTRESIEAIARSVGLGRRQFERRILHAAGVGPVRFRSISRLRRLLRLAGGSPLRPWSALALDAGYADQPHMTREFLRYTGATPERWRRRAADVAIVQDGGIAVD